MTTEMMTVEQTIPERVGTLEEAVKHFATREDLERVKGDLLTAIERVRGEFNVPLKMCSPNRNAPRGN